ncbi:uncharacterized protein LOC133906501 [Phragmites australis]|uniref:uncharacterized protein LOC133906501 n=1 Tax=Phragmites australis TaxID=29695 RepID=UPI002D784B4D|nr:uncharacterized protein LOC133906501 [Phragmites australis]
MRQPDLVGTALSQIQRHVDRALHKYHVTISRQIEGLRHQVGRLAHTCSNCHSGEHTRLEPSQEHVAANGSDTNIQLRFLNDWKPPIYTDKEITDENNAAIKVAVFGGDKIIKTGPLSKAKIEILVLHGGFYNKCRENWTE